MTKVPWCLHGENPTTCHAENIWQVFNLFFAGAARTSARNNLFAKGAIAQYVDVYLFHVLAPSSEKKFKLQFQKCCVLSGRCLSCCALEYVNQFQPLSQLPANLAFIFQGAGGNISSSCAVNSLLLPLACPGDSSFSAHRFGVSEAAPVLMASAMGVPNLLVGDFILSFVKGGNTRNIHFLPKKKISG